MIPRDNRLVASSFWLINHRWIAIIVLAFLIWIANNLFAIDIAVKPLYLLTLLLIIENLLTLWLSDFITQKYKQNIYRAIKLVIHFQISFDLIILTIILHFSGGIANPFFLIYIFHMVISSILLSKIEAYIQTTFALLLFGLIIYLEYKGILPFYCLCIDNTDYELYKDSRYIFKTYGVFVISSYILVFLSTYIGHNLRKQEHKLTIKINELKQNEDLKNQFVLRISNDIKTNIAAMQSNLSVLSSEVFDELNVKQKEILKKSYNRTLELTKYAKNLLHLTRLRLNDEIEKEWLSLGDLIVETINDQYELAEEKEISFDLKHDESIDKYYGNKVSFESIFENLINNAIKYSKYKGVVSIVTKDKHRKIFIEIIDTGIGIPKVELNNIFKDFYRADNVIVTGIKGSGIGLSLVKEGVEIHGGKIRVESQIDIGSKFTIELPKI